MTAFFAALYASLKAGTSSTGIQKPEPKPSSQQGHWSQQSPQVFSSPPIEKPVAISHNASSTASILSASLSMITKFHLPLYSLPRLIDSRKFHS
ncbi:hypothetical protein [Klebsiella phage vB_KshKPC-M]|nr:hypothetical protein [Klebsiella phage vB_KshKPC-M]